MKRAHAIVVLNDTETGIPSIVINTPTLSAIRTAAVSGFLLSKYLAANDVGDLTCGILGLGPIGQLHLQMLVQCFGHKVKHIYLYDINGIAEGLLERYGDRGRFTICTGWEALVEKSDLLVTCTVAKERYIGGSPKKGGLYFNVSLRDFQPFFLRDVDVHMVDNWEEVCRENTDIEKAHLEYGLAREDVLEIGDALKPGKLGALSDKSFMFNPMGMAIYDIAVAKYYLNLGISRSNLIELED
jgi:ornithine cyclodeaminase